MRVIAHFMAVLHLCVQCGMKGNAAQIILAAQRQIRTRVEQDLRRERRRHLTRLLGRVEPPSMSPLAVRGASGTMGGIGLSRWLRLQGGGGDE